MFIQREVVVARGAVGPLQPPGCGPSVWDHLIYAYLVESTGALDVFAEVARRLVAGETLGVLRRESIVWLRNTEELFFRDPDHRIDGEDVPRLEWTLLIRPHIVHRHPYRMLKVPPKRQRRLHRALVLRLEEGMRLDVLRHVPGRFIQDLSGRHPRADVPQQGVAVGDYDNDGFPDIYVSCYGANCLFHNLGDGTYVRVEETAGVADEVGAAEGT